MNPTLTTTEFFVPKLVPRFFRMRDAPRYLGMTRREFNTLVRPNIVEIPIGVQGVAFDRKDLDAWGEWVRSDPAEAVDAPYSSVPYMRWRGARDRARKTGVPFSLTVTDVVQIFRRARDECELTHIPFSSDVRRGPWTPSLDRINPRHGYTRDNCRVICLAVNQAIGRWGERVLYRLVEAFCPGRFSANRSR